MAIKIGTACEVYDKKGVIINIVYYGYAINDNHYFYRSKTEAIASRSGVVFQDTVRPQNYKRFKIRKVL